MFDTLESDIIVMQELKIQRKDLRDDMVILDGWDCYFSLPKHKKGYSGVGIYTRNATCAPIRAEEGLLGVLPSANGVPYCDLPEEQRIGGYPNVFQIAEWGVDPAALDAEGRCLVLEFPAFVLFGVYSPANSNGLRDDFRYGFINALDCRIRNLIRMGKRVVLVGDLNVSRDEKDTAKAFEDCRKNGITHEEYISTPNRRIFNQLLVGGEVAGDRDEGRENGVLWDTTRGFHPTRKGMYTHWEQKINARPGNFGSRIDFVLVTESMRSWIKDANIQEGLLGSDHCPVFADFHDRVTLEDGEVAFADIMNPPGSFVDGERTEEWKLQDAPSLSAKKMPEFDKRRNIMSMFSASKSPAKLPIKSTPEDSTPPGRSSLADTASSANFDTETSQTTNEGTELVSVKRKVSLPTKERPAKKQKPEIKTQNSNGQQSLKGFFKMKEKEVPGVPHEHEHTEKVDSFVSNGISSAKTQSTTGSLDDLPPPSNSATTPPPIDATSPAPTASPSPSEISNQLAANEASQKSWNVLFTKPAAPMCDHNEPCKTMLTKKKGSNQGRSFWMCARPLGPSGEKETGTQWRCGTFIWCSDWTGGKKTGTGT
jgi:AP endonuclease 2